MQLSRFVLSALTAAAVAGAPAIAIASSPAPVATPTLAIDATPTGPSDAVPSQLDVERYAEREAASPEAVEFEGGSAGLYIGVSSGVLAIILVGVLLWVLL